MTHLSEVGRQLAESPEVYPVKDLNFTSPFFIHRAHLTFLLDISGKSSEKLLQTQVRAVAVFEFNGLPVFFFEGI